MPLFVRFHGKLMRAAGAEKIAIEEPIGAVGDLIRVLVSMKPELSEFLREDLVTGSALLILVNGHSVKLMDGMKTKLLWGDVITMDRIDLLQAVGGG